MSKPEKFRIIEKRWVDDSLVDVHAENVSEKLAIILIELMETTRIEQETPNNPGMFLVGKSVLDFQKLRIQPMSEKVNHDE